MNTNDILYYETPIVANRILEYEHVETRAEDSDLNVAVEIGFNITIESVFTHPNDSYLHALVQGSVRQTKEGLMLQEMK